jgi:prepilin-type N-terminal cleavage/methylation domain-containing protein
MRNIFKQISAFCKRPSTQRGYSLLEMLIVISLVITLLSLTTTNLFRFQHTSQLSSTVNSFLADYKEQQIKAMVGDTEGSGAVSNYGIHFETNSYTLFRNSYDTANLAINLPENIQITTPFSNSQIIFQKGSGIISNYDSGNPTNNVIIFTDTVENYSYKLDINKYGVITKLER